MTPAAEEGWEYAFSFDKRFHTPKKGTDNVRRRRWHRKLTSEDPNAILPGLFQLPPKADEVEPLSSSQNLFLIIIGLDATK